MNESTNSIEPDRRDPPGDTAQPDTSDGGGVAESSGSKPRKWWKPVVLLVVIVGLFVAARYFNLGEQLEAAKDWIAGLGPWGPVAFIVIYIAACVGMVPGTILTAAAGGLFGGFWGTVYVSIASTLGATVCFVIARYFARDAVAAWVQGNDKFRKLDKLTETHGGWIVAITRLVPLFPFNLLNYGFGLTRVKLWQYVLWSWLCMLPGTVLYVVGTDAIVRGIQEGKVPWVLVGVVGTVVVVLTVLTWFARGKLRAAEEEADVSIDEP